MKKSIVVFLLFVSSLFSKEINPHLLTSKWQAEWIAHPTAPARDYGVYHFRKTLTLSEKPDAFIIHVSADNRYQLYVNGNFAGNGPARGDLSNWRFESIDIAPFLHSGANVVAAVVWYFGDDAPWAQMMDKAAFILQGNSEDEAILNTDLSWKVTQNTAYSQLDQLRKQAEQFCVIGPGDLVDAAKYPWGWQQIDFDDSQWLQPKSYNKGTPHGYHDAGMPWRLIPRNIPAMEFKEQRLHSVRRTDAISIDDQFLQGEHPVTIPAQTTCTFLLDQSFLTIGYPVLKVSGGTNARINFIYAEALFDENRQKGNRDSIDGKYIMGVSDAFIPDGGEQRIFSPLWLRCWRYIQVEISTQEEPLVLHDLYGLFSAYPLQQNAAFKTDNDVLTKIWQTGWRTARLCAGETYFDCPYYEQLQYVGDTRIQALITLYNSGDDRLMKNAIELFDASRFNKGLTTSRYPSLIEQIIPPYSLFWISMIYDYWMHCDDPAFVQQYAQGIEGVLDWYERRIDKTGMLGPMPYWNFVDWPDEWAWDVSLGIGGIPSGAEDGNSSIISFQFIYVLQQAEQLMRAFDRPHEADHYQKLAENLRQRVHALCWDDEKQMYADTPDKAVYSQHANVTAILCGMPENVDKKKFIRKIVADDELIQCTLYYRFYLTRALVAAGAANDFLDSLQPWQDMLDLGLTTFAERPDPTRSDCHAWSASPNYDFLATVCGIMPAEPGFKSVNIQPAMGSLNKVQAEMPHPLGIIKVNIQKKGKNGVYAEIELPENLTATFFWNDKETACSSGKTVVKY